MSLKEKEPLVNIIMPVFNAQMFVADAISSILEQSYRNIKLLIIDDGSSDGSGEICDRFAEEDSRVEVYHQDNYGLCYARNKGLEKIREGYISFADHDDVYLQGSIEQLVKVAQDNDVDLVKGTYVGEILQSDGRSRIYTAKMPTSVLNLEELVNQYSIFNYAIRAMWNGMYKSEIILDHNIRFDESLKAGAEDYAFNLAYMSFSKQIGLTDYELYKHYARENQSASVGYNENRQKGIIKDYHTEVDMLKGLHITPETYVKHQLWYFYMLIREFCFEDTPLSQKEITERLYLFLNEMEDFLSIGIKDKIQLYKRRPKDMLKWELLHRKCPGILYKHYKLKHG